MYIRIFAHTTILIPYSRTIWNLNWNPLGVVYLVHCLRLSNYRARHLVSLPSLGCYKLWQFILIVLPLWISWLMELLTHYSGLEMNLFRILLYFNKPAGGIPRPMAWNLIIYVKFHLHLLSFRFFKHLLTTGLVLGLFRLHIKLHSTSPVWLFYYQNSSLSGAILISQQNFNIFGLMWRLISLLVLFFLVVPC